MPSLRDPEFNLRWAEDHLKLLRGKITRFENVHRLEIITEEDLKNQLYVIRTKLPYSVEEAFEIAATAGDFVNRLRASLDHLLYGSDKPGTGIHFPITEKDSEDAQIKIAKATFGIPDEAVPIVKSFQPYKSGDLYKTHHLWRLNKLWNIDKHRHLPGHGAGSDIFLHIDIPAPPSQDWLDDEGVVRVPLALKDKVALNPNAGTRFQFADANEGGTCPSMTCLRCTSLWLRQYSQLLRDSSNKAAYAACTDCRRSLAARTWPHQPPAGGKQPFTSISCQEAKSSN